MAHGARLPGHWASASAPSYPGLAELHLCGREERVKHTFILCHFATEVLTESKKSFHVHLCRRSLVSARQWIFDFLQRSSQLECTVLAVTCWFIWESRNDARNNQTIALPRRIAEKIKAYVLMIQEHCYKSTPSTRSEPSSSFLRWTPPPDGVVMVNVDAAVFEAPNRIGIGVVIHNGSGDSLATLQKAIAHYVTPELAEAVAAHEALLFAAAEGFPKVALASDCLSLTHKLREKEMDCSITDAVTSDIKSLASNFLLSSFSHVKRSLNVAAHVLARSSEVVMTTHNDPLLCIRDFLWSDSANI